MQNKGSEKYFRSKKSLGQNFLINAKYLQPILDVADIKDGEIVIEVGPGRGILTEALLKAGAKVYAIEKDFDLIAYLTKKFGTNKNLKIVHQDALFFDLSQFEKYKFVSNLPFNVANPIVRKFLETPNKPDVLVVMVQKEVAEKMIAKPGDSERGVLTLSIEFYGKAEIVTHVPKNAFSPQPDVEAAIVKIVPKNKTDLEPKLFFRIVKAGFASKRRQVHNSLSATLRLPNDEVVLLLEHSNIDPQKRAEDLELNEWVSLAKAYSDKYQINKT